ncbi:MAG: hypothetical protein BWY21_02144 [Parcubacteria group bacterium ADurb.Bin216]|nr:MAG: hypothetical protein BWY21_02144 [Parcubacteria group bacterium ADurb.Bin216]
MTMKEKKDLEFTAVVISMGVGLLAFSTMLVLGAWVLLSLIGHLVS